MHEDYSSKQFKRLKGLENLEASYKNTEASFQKLKAEYVTSSDDLNEKKPTMASQERESLRIALEKLEKDRAAFQSERQKERLKIERQQQQLIEERRKLDEESRRCKEEAETLQMQMDNFYNQTRISTSTRASGKHSARLNAYLQPSLSTRSSAPSDGSLSTTENAEDSESGRTLLARATSPDHPQAPPSGRPSIGSPKLRGSAAENGGRGQGEGSRSTVDGTTSRPPTPGRPASFNTESTKKATPMTTPTTALPTQLASKSKSRSNTFKRNLFSSR
ncbi:unnamed protein product [Schistocephalus solidus]|uniref:CTTNBP2 N-terminal-like protein n=1 Tax=Schistocephalus solidus TaxID=70667 RepID=A0A183SPM2_SCHSO|nr:unnamed protein product [Schistocephalus solidus]